MVCIHTYVRMSCSVCFICNACLCLCMCMCMMYKKQHTFKSGCSLKSLFMQVFKGYLVFPFHATGVP